MQLSKRWKKLTHALIVGFLTGAATGVQLAIAAGGLPLEKKALVALVAGVVGGGISRAAGAFLDWMKTSDSPDLPQPPLHPPEV